MPEPRDRVERIRTARAVIGCEGELQPTIDFFVQRLGLRLERISPADDPRVADLAGHGLALSLERGGGAPGTLRIACDGLGRDDARELTAPNGTRVQLVDATPALVLPPLREELVLTRGGDDADWVNGRAGMRYRDLIPGRLGGRFIASRIRIDEGGPVPDSVHFHAIRFQTIFCAQGQVRVVYEDQGPPFVLRAGDCVLQPPGIRHRVLEASPGLEVIEVACPAEHDTCLDHALELPTNEVRADRDFGGQRFVRSLASEAVWEPWHLPGFERRDVGIAAATDGLADVGVVRATSRPAPTATPWKHADELWFATLLAGRLTVTPLDAEPIELRTGDSLCIPSGLEFSLAADEVLELLEVRVRAARSRAATR